MTIRDQLNEITREMGQIANVVDVTIHASVLHTSEAAARDQGDFWFCPSCRYIELSRRLAKLARVMHDPRLNDRIGMNVQREEDESPAGKQWGEVEEQLERDSQSHAALRAANLLPAPMRNVNPARGRGP